MKKLLLTLTVATLILAGCEKDKPSFVTSKESLVGTYRLTAVTVNNVNVFNNANDDLNLFEPCDRDNQMKLNADESYQLMDAGVACNPSSSDSGTWNFVNATSLKVDGDPVTINSFDGKTLVISESFSGATMITTMQ